MGYGGQVLSQYYQPMPPNASPHIGSGKIIVAAITSGQIYNMRYWIDNASVEYAGLSGRERVDKEATLFQVAAWSRFAAADPARTVQYASRPAVNELGLKVPDDFQRTVPYLQQIAVGEDADYLIIYETYTGTKYEPTAVEPVAVTVGEVPVVGLIASSIFLTATSPLPLHKATQESEIHAYVIDVRRSVYYTFRAAVANEGTYESIAGKFIAKPNREALVHARYFSQIEACFQAFMQWL